MGTSQSSNGSPSGVPMVPPWVPDIPLPPPPFDGPDADADLSAEPSAAPQVPPPDPSVEPSQQISIAPARRFSGANRNFGDFAKRGDRSNLRRGLGQYVKKGYGGSATATRRMAGTAQTAQALYSALSGGAGSPFTTAGGALDPTVTEGHSAAEVMDAVVEAVSPVNGTQDVEASRTSIKDALSDVLNQYPDADLLNLNREQRELAVERFVSADVFRRIDLDLGRAIRDKASNAAIALGRLKEVREYVRETVAASFRKLRDAGRRLVAGQITSVAQSAIRETFQVFEGYAE